MENCWNTHSNIMSENPADPKYWRGPRLCTAKEGMIERIKSCLLLTPFTHYTRHLCSPRGRLCDLSGHKPIRHSTSWMWVLTSSNEFWTAIRSFWEVYITDIKWKRVLKHDQTDSGGYSILCCVHLCPLSSEEETEAGNMGTAQNGHGAY